MALGNLAASGSTTNDSTILFFKELIEDLFSEKVDPKECCLYTLLKDVAKKELTVEDCQVLWNAVLDCFAKWMSYKYSSGHYDQAIQQKVINILTCITSLVLTPIHNTNNEFPQLSLTKPNEVSYLGAVNINKLVSIVEGITDDIAFAKRVTKILLKPVSQFVDTLVLTRGSFHTIREGSKPFFISLLTDFLQLLDAELPILSSFQEHYIEHLIIPDTLKKLAQFIFKLAIDNDEKSYTLRSLFMSLIARLKPRLQSSKQGVRIVGEIETLEGKLDEVSTARRVKSKPELISLYAEDIDDLVDALIAAVLYKYDFTFSGKLQKFDFSEQCEFVEKVAQKFLLQIKFTNDFSEQLEFYNRLHDFLDAAERETNGDILLNMILNSIRVSVALNWTHFNTKMQHTDVFKPNRTQRQSVSVIDVWGDLLNDIIGLMKNIGKIEYPGLLLLLRSLLVNIFLLSYREVIYFFTLNFNSLEYLVNNFNENELFDGIIVAPKSTEDVLFSLAVSYLRSDIVSFYNLLETHKTKLQQGRFYNIAFLGWCLTVTDRERSSRVLQKSRHQAKNVRAALRMQDNTGTVKTDVILQSLWQPFLAKRFLSACTIDFLSEFIEATVGHTDILQFGIGADFIGQHATYAECVFTIYNKLIIDYEAFMTQSSIMDARYKLLMLQKSILLHYIMCLPPRYILAEQHCQHEKLKQPNTEPTIQTGYTDPFMANIFIMPNLLSSTARRQDSSKSSYQKNNNEIKLAASQNNYKICMLLHCRRLFQFSISMEDLAELLPEGGIMFMQILQRIRSILWVTPIELDIDTILKQLDLSVASLSNLARYIIFLEILAGLITVAADKLCDAIENKNFDLVELLQKLSTQLRLDDMKVSNCVEEEYLESIVNLCQSLCLRTVEVASQMPYYGSSIVAEKIHDFLLAGLIMNIKAQLFYCDRDILLQELKGVSQSKKEVRLMVGRQTTKLTAFSVYGRLAAVLLNALYVFKVAHINSRLYDYKQRLLYVFGSQTILKNLIFFYCYLEVQRQKALSPYRYDNIVIELLVLLKKEFYSCLKLHSNSELLESVLQDKDRGLDSELFKHSMFEYFYELGLEFVPVDEVVAMSRAILVSNSHKRIIGSNWLMAMFYSVARSHRLNFLKKLIVIVNDCLRFDSEQNPHIKEFLNRLTEEIFTFPIRRQAMLESFAAHMTLIIAYSTNQDRDKFLCFFRAYIASLTDYHGRIADKSYNWQEDRARSEQLFQCLDIADLSIELYHCLLQASVESSVYYRIEDSDSSLQLPHIRLLLMVRKFFSTQINVITELYQILQNNKGTLTDETSSIMFLLSLYTFWRNKVEQPSKHQQMCLAVTADIVTQQFKTFFSISEEQAQMLVAMFSTFRLGLQGSVSCQLSLDYRQWLMGLREKLFYNPEIFNPLLFLLSRFYNSPEMRVEHVYNYFLPTLLTPLLFTRLFTYKSNAVQEFDEHLGAITFGKIYNKSSVDFLMSLALVVLRFIDFAIESHVDILMQLLVLFANKSSFLYMGFKLLTENRDARSREELFDSLYLRSRMPNVMFRSAVNNFMIFFDCFYSFKEPRLIGTRESKHISQLPKSMQLCVMLRLADGYSLPDEILGHCAVPIATLWSQSLLPSSAERFTPFYVDPNFLRKIFILQSLLKYVPLQQALLQFTEGVLDLKTMNDMERCIVYWELWTFVLYSDAILPYGHNNQLALSEQDISMLLNMTTSIVRMACQGIVTAADLSQFFMMLHEVQQCYLMPNSILVAENNKRLSQPDAENWSGLFAVSLKTVQEQNLLLLQMSLKVYTPWLLMKEYIDECRDFDDYQIAVVKFGIGTILINYFKNFVNEDDNAFLEQLTLSQAQFWKLFRCFAQLLLFGLPNGKEALGLFCKVLQYYEDRVSVDTAQLIRRDTTTLQDVVERVSNLSSLVYETLSGPISSDDINLLADAKSMYRRLIALGDQDEYVHYITEALQGVTCHFTLKPDDFMEMLICIRARKEGDDLEIVEFLIESISNLYKDPRYTKDIQAWFVNLVLYFRNKGFETGRFCYDNHRRYSLTVLHLYVAFIWQLNYTIKVDLNFGESCNVQSLGFVATEFLDILLDMTVYKRKTVGFFDDNLSMAGFVTKSFPQYLCLATLLELVQVFAIYSKPNSRLFEHLNQYYSAEENTNIFYGSTYLDTLDANQRSLIVVLRLFVFTHARDYATLLNLLEQYHDCIASIRDMPIALLVFLHGQMSNEKSPEQPPEQSVVSIMDCINSKLKVLLMSRLVVELERVANDERILKQTLRKILYQIILNVEFTRDFILFLCHNKMFRVDYLPLLPGALLSIYEEYSAISELSQFAEKVLFVIRNYDNWVCESSNPDADYNYDPFISADYIRTDFNEFAQLYPMVEYRVRLFSLFRYLTRQIKMLFPLLPEPGVGLSAKQRRSAACNYTKFIFFHSFRVFLLVALKKSVPIKPLQVLLRQYLQEAITLEIIKSKDFTTIAEILRLPVSALQKNTSIKVTTYKATALDIVEEINGLRVLEPLKLREELQGNVFARFDDELPTITVAECFIIITDVLLHIMDRDVDAVLRNKLITLLQQLFSFITPRRTVDSLTDIINISAFIQLLRFQLELGGVVAHMLPTTFLNYLSEQIDLLEDCSVEYLNNFMPKFAEKDPRYTATQQLDVIVSQSTELQSESTEDSLDKHEDVDDDDTEVYYSETVPKDWECDFTGNDSGEDDDAKDLAGQNVVGLRMASQALRKMGGLVVGAAKSIGARSEDDGVNSEASAVARRAIADQHSRRVISHRHGRTHTSLYLL